MSDTFSAGDDFQEGTIRTIQFKKFSEGYLSVEVNTEGASFGFLIMETDESQLKTALEQDLVHNTEHEARQYLDLLRMLAVDVGMVSDAVAGLEAPN